MELVSKPIALPGQCKGCGAADRGPYVDTGWSEDFYGAIYFCRDCTLEMAALYGFVSPEHFSAVNLELERANQTINVLALKEQHNSQILEGVDGLLSIRSRGGAHSVIPNPGLALLEPQGSSPGEASLVEGEGKSSKPSNVKGVGDIRPGKPIPAIKLGPGLSFD